ncbi:restriction endonuclease subunit S [Vibrio alginolyticus]|nr:restriction endonuclease subunit S [Vibrio alginolyticus]
MVPNVSLADLLDLSQYGLSVSSVENGQYPMFKMNNFRNGFMSEKGVDTVNLDETEFDKYRLEYGDILFNRTNSIDLVGKTGIFTLEGDYVFASYLVRLKVNRDIADPFYLNYFMNFDATKLRLRSLATKAVSQANINPTQLKKLLKVPLLPLSEQRKIAKILSTWDKAIATTEKLIDTSKQQKKALMQQLLTGKKRLVNPETGKVFEGEWEEVHVSDIATTKKGKALSAKDIVAGKYPVIAGGKSSPYTHNNFTHENVITISASGAYAGYVSYHPYKIWASDCSVIEAKVNNCLGFIFQWLLLNQNRIYSMQSGGAQPHIYPKDIDVLRLRKPQFDEQQKIASVLTAADKEIEVLEAKLAHFKQEKKALMQQLLTGKRRVTVDT